jgi:hypothetical protein
VTNDKQRPRRIQTDLTLEGRKFIGALLFLLLQWVRRMRERHICFLFISVYTSISFNLLMYLLQLLGTTFRLLTIQSQHPILKGKRASRSSKYTFLIK